MAENYAEAFKLGKREYHARRIRRENPFLPVLDEIAPNATALPSRPLKLVNIPINRIVGTATRGRTSAFAANFMPLLEENSEFAAKWERLYLSVVDEGMKAPVKAFEYLNKFYIIEGNKRVSVMKFLDAVSVEGEVTRLIPPPSDDLENKIYYEFLGFYEDSDVNFVWFSQTGGFARLYEFMNMTPGRRWTHDERLEFHSAYMRFDRCYHLLEENRLAITTGDAFLIFLEIYGYKYACTAFGDEYETSVRNIRDEFRVRSQNERVRLVLEPEAASQNLISSLFGGRRKLTAAFLYNRHPEESGWSYWHEMGRSHVDALLEGQVKTLTRVAESDEQAQDIIEQLIREGTDVIFATSPEFLNAAVKASVEHGDVKILNCSLQAAFRHVRSYYLRIYEAKFIIGAIAGAVTKNGRVGYIADYPIYGTPASINAFALGVRLVNPSAHVFLDWSTLKDHDPVEYFRLNDVRVISNRDICAPGRGSRDFGLYVLGQDGQPTNLAMPVWNWGRLYETILRTMLSGSWQRDGHGDAALGYWPGFSTGAIDVFYSQRLPAGIQQLADILRSQFVSGYNPFTGLILSQDGAQRNRGDHELSPAELIAMDWLCDNVIGSIPDITPLRDEARPLVRLQGIHDSISPDPDTFSWTDPENEV